jgi:hypothetical protein
MSVTKPTSPVLQSNADSVNLVYFGVAYEGSGTTLHDLSVTGLTGTLTSSAIWNGSGLFSGPDLNIAADNTKYVSFGSNGPFAPAGSFSVCTSVKLTSVDVQVFAGCYGLTAGSFDTGWAVGTDDAHSGKVKFFTAASVSGEIADTLLSATVLSTGVAYDIVCTYDSGTGAKKIYIDGTLDASNTWASGPCTFSTALAHIGQLEYTASGQQHIQPARGEVSYVSLYSVAISSGIVTDLHTDPFVAVRPVAVSVNLPTAVVHRSARTPGLSMGSASRPFRFLPDERGAPPRPLTRRGPRRYVLGAAKPFQYS